MKQLEKYNSPDGFLHPYFPHGIIDGDFRVKPDNKVSYYKGTISLSADREDPYYLQPANELLPNRGLEPPQEVLAIALLSNHPMVRYGECHFTYTEVMDCPQGVFKLKDRHGHDWMYVLKTVDTNDDGLKVLWALSSCSRDSYGYFNLTSTQDYRWKVKGEAKTVTHESVQDSIIERRQQEYRQIRETETSLHEKQVDAWNLEVASDHESELVDNEPASGDTIRRLFSNLTTTDEKCHALNCIVDLANATKSEEAQQQLLEELTAYYQSEIAPLADPDPKLAYRLFSMINPDPFYPGGQPSPVSHDADAHYLDYVLNMRRAKIKQLPQGPNIN